MITVNIGKVNFELAEFHDFSWVNEIGLATEVKEDSEKGTISFDVKKDKNHYRITYAGAKLVNGIEPKTAIQELRKNIKMLEDEQNDDSEKSIRKFEKTEGIFYVYKQ